MKIPKQLKIGGHIYKIVRKDTYRNEQQMNCGYCNSENNELTIDTKLADTAQASTLLHEIIEAINYNNELKLEHNQIMSLESNLYQILHDNKLIF